MRHHRSACPRTLASSMNLSSLNTRKMRPNLNTHSNSSLRTWGTKKNSTADASIKSKKLNR